MSKQRFDIVALAIETIECSTKAIDTSKVNCASRRWSNGYTMKAWAADVLYQLPADREKALLIVKAHMPGGVAPENRRRVGQLCGRYYRKLENIGLLRHGERFLKIMG